MRACDRRRWLVVGGPGFSSCQGHLALYMKRYGTLRVDANSVVGFASVAWAAFQFGVAGDVPKGQPQMGVPVGGDGHLTHIIRFGAAFTLIGHCLTVSFSVISGSPYGSDFFSF